MKEQRMRYAITSIVYQEVPNETSFAISITGCPSRCKGCHSAYLRDPLEGVELTKRDFRFMLNKYQDDITTVLFFGGEWYPKQLLDLLNIVNEYELKSALYSGLDTLDSIPDTIKNKLSYIKIGSYKEELGALTSPTTNQKLYKIENGVYTHIPMNGEK